MLVIGPVGQFPKCKKQDIIRDPIFHLFPFVPDPASHFYLVSVRSCFCPGRSKMVGIFWESMQDGMGFFYAVFSPGSTHRNKGSMQP
jgi:hypothetical protein